MAQVTKKREVRTHAELWHTANCLLDTGQKEIKGSMHQFRAALVFQAFSVEALLNWKTGDRRDVPHQFAAVLRRVAHPSARF
jgi:hypothetical protein